MVSALNNKTLICFCSLLHACQLYYYKTIYLLIIKKPSLVQLLRITLHSQLSREAFFRSKIIDF